MWVLTVPQLKIQRWRKAGNNGGGRVARPRALSPAAKSVSAVRIRCWGQGGGPILPVLTKMRREVTKLGRRGALLRSPVSAVLDVWVAEACGRESWR